jgi:hypothetical protein
LPIAIQQIELNGKFRKTETELPLQYQFRNFGFASIEPLQFFKNDQHYAEDTFAKMSVISFFDFEGVKREIKLKHYADFVVFTPSGEHFATVQVGTDRLTVHIFETKRAKWLKSINMDQPSPEIGTERSKLLLMPDLSLIILNTSNERTSLVKIGRSK